MAGTLSVPPVEGALKRGVDMLEVIWAEGAEHGQPLRRSLEGPGIRRQVQDLAKNTTEENALFGSANDPTNVKPGKKYSVQVRSEDSSNPKKRNSDWSPALKLQLDA